MVGPNFSSCSRPTLIGAWLQSLLHILDVSVHRQSFGVYMGSPNTGRAGQAEYPIDEWNEISAKKGNFATRLSNAKERQLLPA